MMKELTEKQREILEYARENGRVATANLFSLSLCQVGYIIYKNNKSNKQNVLNHKLLDAK